MEMDRNSKERLQQLKDNGFVVFQLLSSAEAAAVKKHVQGLEEQGIGHPSDVQHRIAELLTADDSSPLVARLICHPDVLGVLHGFLGPKCRCATFSSNTLFCQDGSLGSGLGWHPDYPYHDLDEPWPPPEFPLGCQVLICLDEFRPDNGGTMFMPESHKHKPEGIEEDYEGTYPGSMTLSAPAGSVLIAHSAWWHRQTKNVSKQPRRALLGNYTPGFVVPKDNMEKQWLLFKQGPGFAQALLSQGEKAQLERLMLGPFKRGVFNTQ